MLAVAAVYAVSAYAYTIAGSLLDKGFIADLRKTAIDKVLELSLDQHQTYGASDLLDGVLRQTDRLRGFTERVLTRGLTNGVRAVYPVVMLFLIDPTLAIAALAVVPLHWVVAWRLQKRLHAATRAAMASHADLAAALHETLDGIETVQSLNAFDTASKRLREFTDRVEADELRSDRITARLRAATWFLTGIGIAVVWWLGGLRTLRGEMSLGLLIAFAGYAEFAYRPFRLFTNIAKTYRAGVASLERVGELLGRKPSVQDSADAVPLHVMEGAISARDLTFSFGAKGVLSGLCFDCPPFAITALVGPNGSGKSTLLRLLAKLYPPQRGDVFIDGQACSNSTLSSWRGPVAYVPQRPVLFSGTVFDNVRLAKPDATAEEVYLACRASSALEFIEKLDQGFETPLGRRGAELSVGQLQRLGLARALLLHPRILLLDEPTAACDAASESAMAKTLSGLRGSMTIVLAAHRSATIGIADHFVVLDHGRVVAEGTRQDFEKYVRESGGDDA